LVTPEGRLLLHAFDEAVDADSGELVRLSSASFVDAESQLLAFYRELAQQRIRGVLRIRNSQDAPLLLPAGVGTIVFLLINRSTDVDRAIRRPNDQTQFQRVDEAIQMVVEAFAETLVPSVRGRGRRRDQYSLYGGYALTEARRRLGADTLVIDSTSRIYLAGGSEQLASARVLWEVKRRPDGPKHFPRAFDELVAMYREVRPVLAANKMAHERPADTDALRATLLRDLDGLDPSPGWRTQ
jgi:hypothetical protein